MSIPSALYVFHGLGAGVSCVKFVTIDDKQLILAGTSNGFIKCFDFKSKKLLTTIDVAQLYFSNASADEKLGISAFGVCESILWVHVRNGGVAILQTDALLDDNWTPTDSKVILPSSHYGFCGSCSFGLDSGAHLLAVPSDRDSKPIIQIYRIPEPYNPFETIDLSSDNNRGQPLCMKLISEQFILIGFENGELICWDFIKGKQCSSLKLHEECVLCMDYNPVINTGFSGSVSGSIHEWRVNDGILSQASRTIDVGKKTGVASISIRGVGKIVIGAFWDQKARLYSTKSMKLLAVLDYHRDNLNCVAFVPPDWAGDKSFAIGDKQGTLSLWDLYANK